MNVNYIPVEYGLIKLKLTERELLKFAVTAIQLEDMLSKDGEAAVVDTYTGAELLVQAEFDVLKHTAIHLAYSRQHAAYSLLANNKSYLIPREAVQGILAVIRVSPEFAHRKITRMQLDGWGEAITGKRFDQICQPIADNYRPTYHDRYQGLDIVDCLDFADAFDAEMERRGLPNRAHRESKLYRFTKIAENLNFRLQL